MTNTCFLEILTQEVTYFAINNINLNKCQMKHYFIQLSTMIVFILYSLQQKKIIDIVYDFFFWFFKVNIWLQAQSTYRPEKN